MKNLLSYASKLATTLPLAIVLVSIMSSSAMAQVDTSAAAVGQQNHINNMATGSQAMQSYSNIGNPMVGRYGSYGVGLNPTMSAVQGLRSMNTSGLPSGGFNYGFQGTGFNNVGATGGQYLPTTSTGSVDLNIVENTNYALYGGSGGLPINQLPIINPLSNAAASLENAAANSAQVINGLNSMFGQ